MLTFSMFVLRGPSAAPLPYLCSKPNVGEVDLVDRLDFGTGAVTVERQPSERVKDWSKD